MEQILAGREFGINHDADFLAMNPNGLVPLLRDDESDPILWGIKRHCPLSGGTVRAKTPVDRLHQHVVRKRKMDGLGKTRHLSNAHRGIPMGLVRTPPEER